MHRHYGLSNRGIQALSLSNIEITFRVLDLSEIDFVTKFEKSLLDSMNISEQEATLLSWSAPWRRESLEHYIPKGWCFAAWKESSLVGYFLAQPLIFFRGNTQSLWVEHIACFDETVKSQLIDLARRYGRDKHLQCVLFAQDPNTNATLTELGAKIIQDKIFEFSTTKSIPLKSGSNS
jgi:hypothetical protein